MADIILTTLNARFIHTAFGLRYLAANMGELSSDTAIREFDIKCRPIDIAESILDEDPKIVGLGVYLWNIDPCTHLVRVLRQVRPKLVIVLGGPEVSYETQDLPIVRDADHVIQGEGDLAFADLCRALLAGHHPPPIISAQPPPLESLQMPYPLYSDEDIAHRVVYLETSRGCPFRCDFCLSALDRQVRFFAFDRIAAALDELLARGVRQFKFVDRTFNLDETRAEEVMRFFLDRKVPDLFLHFEMIPDRFPKSLRQVLAAFPEGAVQLEVGIQTFNPQVAERIHRYQDLEKLSEYLSWLRKKTGVHLHTDLILGLPGEDMASIQKGFDRLVALRPQEIQVGILKRLKGAPIARHDDAWNMVYNPRPPYDVLCNRHLNFETMQRLRRFARYWDLVSNSGNFLTTTELIWGDGSPFDGFLRWSDWLFAQAKRTHSIALSKLAEYLYRYLIEERRIDSGLVATRMAEDFRGTPHRDLPGFIQGRHRSPPSAPHPAVKGLDRQTRHRTR